MLFSNVATLFKCGNIFSTKSNDLSDRLTSYGLIKILLFWWTVLKICFNDLETVKFPVLIF